MLARLTVIVLVWVLTVATVRAQDPATEVAKQKSIALENMKKASVAKPALLETADLLITGTLTEPKLKVIGDLAQKTFVFVKKTLPIEDKEKLWPGKLTVYVAPEWRTYSEMVRAVDERKAEKGEVSIINYRAAQPFLIVGADLGEKPTDAEFASTAAAWVAALLLNKNAGLANGTSTMPEWVQLGYGRAAVLRAENNTTKLASYRAKAKTLAQGGKTRGPANFADAWAETKSQDYETLITSTVDFLAFGPDPAKFPKFVASFKPSEERPMPTVATAIESMKWKADALDNAWRTWVLKGGK